MDWKNKKLWLIGGAAVIAVIVLCIFLFAKNVREVNVIEFNGSVEVERPTIADLLAVFTGMRLEEGDFIQTRESSSVTMTIDQNKIAKLAENSRASFDEVAEGKGGQVTSIYLESGTLINDIKEKLSEDATYKVSTPNATVSVRGTYFVVSVGPEEGYDGIVTKINVYSGSVKVENVKGEVIILYANEAGVKEGNGKEKSGDSTLILPSGNHALVGAKKMVVYDYVDYSGLDESDLLRLEELVREGKSPLVLEDIEAWREQLTGQAEETTTEEMLGGEQVETEAALPEEEIAESPKENTKAKDTEKNPGNKQPGGEQPKIEVPGNGSIDTPIIEVVPVPQEKPPVNTGSNQGGESSGGGSPQTPPPTPPEETYESLLLQITNLAEIEGQMSDLQSKITIMAEIANESGDSSWTGQIQQAQNDIGQTQGILDSVVRVNAILNQINGLPQPAQITEADRAGVVSARGAYEGLTGDEKTLIPDSSLEKMAACEGKL